MAFQRRRYGFGAGEDRPGTTSPPQARQAPPVLPDDVRHTRTKRQTAGVIADIDNRFVIDLLSKQITVRDQQDPSIYRIRFAALGSDQGADEFDDDGTNLSAHTPTNANFPGWEYTGAATQWVCEQGGVSHASNGIIARSNADLVDNFFSVEVTTTRGGVDDNGQSGVIVLWADSNLSSFTGVFIGWSRAGASTVNYAASRWAAGVLQESNTFANNIALAANEPVVIGIEVEDDTILLYTRPIGSSVHTVRGSWTISVNLRDGLHRRIGIATGTAGSRRTIFDDFSIFSYRLDAGGDVTQDLWGLNVYDINGTLIFGTGSHTLGPSGNVFLSNQTVHGTATITQHNPSLEWGSTKGLATLTSIHDASPGINILGTTDNFIFWRNDIPIMNLQGTNNVLILSTGDLATGVPGLFFDTGGIVVGPGSVTGTSWTVEGTSYTSFIAALDYGDPIGPNHIIETLSDAAGRPARFWFARAHINVTSPEAVVDDDVVANIDFLAHDGTDFNVGARIFVDIDGAVSSNTVPMRMILQTSATNSAGLVNNLILTPALATFSTDLVIGTDPTGSEILRVGGSGLFRGTDIILESEGGGSEIWSRSWHTSPVAAFVGQAARGTIASPTAVQANDQLVTFAGIGYGATGFSATPRVAVQMIANGTWTDASQPTRINLRTTSTGSTSITTRWFINPAGHFRPAAGNSYDIGSAGNAGRDLYLDGDATIGGDVIGSGGLALNIVARSGNYTATTSDFTITEDASGGAVTVTLLASPRTGMILYVKKIDSSGNHVTVDGNGNNIDGDPSFPISTQYETVPFHWGGSEWHVL